MKKKLGFKWV